MSTADHPPDTDDARAEAERRWDLWRNIRNSWDARAMQAAFVAGAEWAAGRAETTTATTEDAGSTSDGHHTFDELYEYRMLYNAHAAHGWLADGIPVVKSWHHSDGEPCFGGGWFIVTATLTTGQVSNHYQADHWDLFQVPEVSLPPEWDGHTPSGAADRLREALHHLAITAGGWDAHAFAGALARTWEDE